MTNILLLPQLDGTKTIFNIPLNSDWLDAVYFTAPGSSQVPLTILGSVTTGSNIFTLSAQSPLTTLAGVIPGMPFTAAPGFPLGGFVGAVTSSTTVTLVNAAGAALNSTITDAELTVTFVPLLIDCTGIRFRAHIRPAPGSGVLHLGCDTNSGTIINGGNTGAVGFFVPQVTIGNLPVGTWVMDILAIADGHVINLFQNAPATVIVGAGVTTYP